VRWGYTLISVVLLVVVALVAAVAVATLTGGGGSSGYQVRVIFDNSSFVIPGEQVKVAGVTVGTINRVDLTQQNKAAVVIQINNRQFTPFHTDAHCEIDLESLLGEQYVQCTPTQPKAAGAYGALAAVGTAAPGALAASGDPAPPLPAIASGPNKGQHLLPVENTTSPVGFDLLQNIQRLPQRERFRLIIAGLGAGLAGNGQELNAALVRADPALQETDKVIAVLASQNQLLARLTDESARVLAPLAAQRAHFAGFFRHAGAVAVASAQEGQAIQQNWKDFPPFLRQLVPYTARLSNLANQMIPALQSLQAQAPAINTSLQGFGPLVDASIPPLKTLGSLAHRGESVFPAINPLARQLLALGKPLQPVANNLGAITQSFDNAGGIENFMRFIYYYAGATNGENALGHYIRSLIEVGGCTSRSSIPIPGCQATFGIPGIGPPVHVAHDAQDGRVRAARDGAARAARDGSARAASRGHGHASGQQPSHGASTQQASAQPAALDARLTGSSTTPAAYNSSKALLDYLLAP
jgi:ABC-type transporter Mla subunit MlaD